MPYIGKSPGNGVRQRYIYAATAGQTSFSGNDSAGISLAYDDPSYLDVYQNGVLLKPVRTMLLQPEPALFLLQELRLMT